MLFRMVLIVLLSVGSFCYGRELPIKSGDKIAFLGASITQFGWSNQEGYIHLVVSGLKAEGIEVTPIPAGISGNESHQMLERVQRDVIDKHPQWMTFKVGGNDVWHKAHTIEQFEKNVIEVVDRVTAAGIKIMFITQTPLGEDTSDPRNIRLAAFNEFIRKLAKERHCLLADANTDMSNALSNRRKGDPNRMTTDGVHLNSWGNRLVARSILRAFGVPDFSGKVTPMNKAFCYEFPLKGHSVKIIVPDKQAEGKPWLMRTVYWRAFPNSEDAMIQKGWAVAYIETNDRFGTPQDNTQRTDLYYYLVQEFGFSPRPVVYGMSLGGLSALRWVMENPDKCCGIYVDAPAADFRNWKNNPNSSELWRIVTRDYGMSEEVLLNGEGNPIYGCKKIASAKIPMLLICGAADKIVSYEKNGKLLAEQFKAAGGDLTEIVKQDCDHHPHGLTDPAPVVQFFEKCREKTFD